jgi:hypothetical protein
MKTAVEWLFGQFVKKSCITLKDIQIAKEMEKNNLYECGSFWRGKENKIEKPFFEQWYKETFKSE